MTTALTIEGWPHNTYHDEIRGPVSTPRPKNVTHTS